MIDDDKKSVLTNLIIKILTPVVRLVVSKNMSFGEFSALAREVFVDVVVDDLSKNGKKATNDKVSVITGINRKDVRRFRNLKEQQTEIGNRVAITKHNRVERVMHGWMNDKDFQDHKGNPLPLSNAGVDPALKGKDSEFYLLVKKYGGDVHSSSILEEMQRIACVSVEGDLITLKEGAYVPSEDELELLRRYGVSVTDFMETMSFNVNNSKEGNTRFEMQLAYDNLPIEWVEKFRERNDKKSMTYLKEMNAWLSKYDRDINPEVKGHERYRAGIGIYYFESPLEENEE